MQLAGPWAVNAPPDRVSAFGVLRAAVTAGIDHIDTTQYYGPDVVNDLIREALCPYPSELAIVSKVGVRRDAGAVIRHDDARLPARLAARRGHPVLTSPVVIHTAGRLGVTRAQVALQWLLRLAPNVLLIPGTGSTGHLREAGT